MRIADPQPGARGALRDVFVASLQDGEFPRRRGGATRSSPSASASRSACGPRRDAEAEERYLFHACLALPRRRLFLSYRDSDENGAAEAPSPFLDDVRRLLEPFAAEDDRRSERGRDLAEVVHRVADAPSETELARAIAARGAGADAGRCSTPPAPSRGRRAGRGAAGGRRARRARDPGAGAAREPRGDRSLARSTPTAARPWRASTSAPIAGSSPTSSPRSRSTRHPTRWSRAV